MAQFLSKIAQKFTVTDFPRKVDVFAAKTHLAKMFAAIDFKSSPKGNKSPNLVTLRSRNVKRRKNGMKLGISSLDRLPR